MNEQTCPQCQKSFVPHAKKPQTFCSRECFFQSRKRQVDRTCERCGKSFSTYQARGSARFCSWKCRAHQVECKCEYCGRPFYVRASRQGKRVTCSRSCLMKLRAQQGRTPNQGKVKNINTRLKVSTGLKRYYNNDPTKHWNYKAGPFSQRRGRHSSWQEQRRQARERDKYTCRVCGIAEIQLGKQLSVHHIKPFRYFANSKEANRLDNLISTCQSCHMKLEHGTVTIPEQHPTPQVVPD